MNKNLESPTKLAEFAPLQQEDRSQSVGQFISSFFKMGGKPEDGASGEDATEESETAREPSIYDVDLSEGRSLPNVLKRISNLLALKSNNLQDYADTELKKYWMPDSVSKECYECSEKFKVYRRRHHCRVCGQIFCSQCCNQHIPGKIFGCTGDLRVCTYCCKIVLSYMQSSNFGADLSADLGHLQKDLRAKFGDPSGPVSSPNKPSETNDALRRKISVGYRDEQFSPGSAYLSPEEKLRALRSSASLCGLYDEVCGAQFGRTLADHFVGSELVDWLIARHKATTRVQAVAICQALLDGGYVECLAEPSPFVDGDARYRKGAGTQRPFEPSWVKQIPHEGASPGLRSSDSYTLDLDVEASTVYLSKPADEDRRRSPEPRIHESAVVVRPTEQLGAAPESGWFDATSLRDENGEREAYERLTETYERHEQSLWKQLLSSEGLSHSWIDAVSPLIREAVAVVRPDKHHDAIDLDVRHYVQFKKVAGGRRGDSRLVPGVVCSKHVAHRDMDVDVVDPKVLLLQCAVVYQRTEGRLMSLEPLLMQENEYLRHVCARIVAFRPDVVVVHRNVSRLAQDMLRESKIVLVYNVKRTVMDRLARCTGADVVAAVDSHIGRPRLGTCARFYSRNLDGKRLMFFEGLPRPWLGGTVLLRGGAERELARLKRVASLALLAAYNWRLEKSFLMDEFAMPPDPKCEFLDSPSSPPPPPSPAKHPSPQPPQTESKRGAVVEAIDDFTDPLHCDGPASVNDQVMAVAELPLANAFRKHLGDAILCVSPYVVFSVPYLETDAGKKCELRRFFPKDMYHSSQFDPASGKQQRRDEANVVTSDVKETVALHPFLALKIIAVELRDVQNELAHFRACGGRYPKKETLSVPTPKEPSERPAAAAAAADCLDPANHQRLAVLFCSFSHESANAPSFCVNPWVVYMDFYGRNDIPLGCFLERYCFRPSYACPSKTCDSPMVKHVRRFVHGAGCVTVSLDDFDHEFSDEAIVTWTWCTRCQSVSPVAPLSADSWSYPFAKYLELKFHGDAFGRRGPSPCRHSLHHDHYQYFGYRKYVASFKYTSVATWEIRLPRLRIGLARGPVTRARESLAEEARALARKAHDRFAAVHERLSSVCVEEADGHLVQAVVKEQMQFKRRVEDVVALLGAEEAEPEAAWAACGETARALAAAKLSLLETVDAWNVTLQEGRKRDKEQGSPVASPDEGDGDADVAAKNILEKLLAPAANAGPIAAPFGPQEHYWDAAGAVFEAELSSIVAHALATPDYKKALEELTSKSPSPATKRKNLADKTDEEKASGLLGFLRGKEGGSDGEAEPATPDDARKSRNAHVEVHFQDGASKFSCTAYLADKFAALRSALVPSGEDGYVRSLSRSMRWNVRGGKSGSTFAKTWDDRFVLKDLSKTEVQLFLEFAAHYFAYVEKCATSGQPSLLAKIVGVYQVSLRNAANATSKTDLLVMENLFYDRDVSQKFDLKGSMRNRLVVPDKLPDGEVVFLDENLLKMTCESPLYVLPHSKEVLMAAIQNDTDFLSAHSVMDYSLVVGLDAVDRNLVVGIIDYIRTFTWDKRIEHIFKKIGGQGKLPTIVSPEEYQKRFVDAMHNYFLEVPDHWAGLGKGIDL
ncbi:1-phosphatidylinositol 3-phosphate 5-kinase [Cylas formicarius]|uniref:1-phosphatidylinositol 3-phosphate 5-kinase n=1 Tax=Cylas formicarius TaxID=197179 RepID=UPI002958CE4B|nr:1-phosphatidylinositol 3-phosphate 5-kinase [Cylas formicarius]